MKIYYAIFFIYWIGISVYTTYLIVEGYYKNHKTLINGINLLKTAPESIRLKLDYLERMKNHICKMNKINPDFHIVMRDSNGDNAICFDGNRFICFDRGLLIKSSHKELAAILAHEIAHMNFNSHKRDLLISYALPLASLVVFLPIGNSLATMEADNVGQMIIAIIVSLVYSYFFSLYLNTVMVLCSYISSWLRRREEILCDIFAAKCVGIRAYLSQSYSVDNDYLREDNLFEKLDSSHPTWVQRRSKVLASLKK